uniref:Uncharacterized protein n=1 Tax=Anguilla anguilla TaxID=7936 RepID=A0A0E9S283_ANGAN
MSLLERKTACLCFSFIHLCSKDSFSFCAKWRLRFYYIMLIMHL